MINGVVYIQACRHSDEKHTESNSASAIGAIRRILRMNLFLLFTVVTLFTLRLSSGADILISASGEGVIYRLNESTGVISIFAAGISIPEGIVVGPDGMVYVAAYGTFQILRYFPNGTFDRVFCDAQYASSLVFDNSGNLYFKANGRMYRRSPGSTLSVDLGLGGGDQLVMGPDGYIYYAVRDDYPILGPDGGTVHKFKTDGSETTAVLHLAGGPTGVAFADDGTLYVAGSISGEIYRWNGSTLTFFTSFPSQWGALDGLCFANNGDLIACTSWPFVVHRVKPDGTSTFLVTGIRFPQFATATPPVQPLLSAISISPAALSSGVSATGKVTIDHPAPKGGTMVALMSSNPGVASVPVTVMVPQNATQATFPVTAGAVIDPIPVSITASLLGGNKSKSIVVSAPALSSITLNPSSVVGGSDTIGTVSLTAAPLVNMSVTLSTTNASAHVLASVVVPSGSASVTFTIPTDLVTVNTVGTVKAVLGSVNKSATLTVKAPVLSTFALNATSVIGGTNVTGTVTLTGPAAVDTVVPVTCANAKAHVPASVTVLAGNSTANFNVTTDAVSAATSCAISVGFGGISKSVTLKVNPPTYLSFALTPNPVHGGEVVIGTATMSGPVAADTVVSLTNANVKAALPGASVTILAGTSSVSFTVTTMPTAANVSGAVKAQVGTVVKSVTLKVTP